MTRTITTMSGMKNTKKSSSLAEAFVHHSHLQKKKTKKKVEGRRLFI
jgi:hypothetical protein